MPRCRDTFWTDPLMYQGGSDDFLGPTDDALFASEEWGIDFEAEVAVIVDDVPMGARPTEARSQIRLLMLVNDWSLRNLVPAELAKGFGFFQSQAGHRILAGGGHARRTRRGMARQQGAPADPCASGTASRWARPTPATTWCSTSPG